MFKRLLLKLTNCTYVPLKLLHTNPDGNSKTGRKKTNNRLYSISNHLLL